MKSSLPLLKESLADHWFALCNQRMVKIFKADEAHHLQMIHSFEYNSSYGKAKSPIHMENKKHHAREENALHFAREISQFLQKEKQAGHFQTLTVAAEPRFLGKIKAVLPCDVKACVINWEHKDLEKTPNKDLAGHLIPELTAM